jgi:hypothetical protein
MTNTERAIELSGADIDAIVAGYLECQLWAGLDYGHTGCDDNAECRNSADPEPHPYDDNYSVENISPEYVAKVREELSDVVTAHPLAVRMYLAHRSTRERVAAGFNRVDAVITSEYFGHDFYLTREHHGVGFWDRGLGELGEYLTKIAKSYGSAETLWDNGDGVLNA